jgi:NAD+ kinase
MRFAIYGTEFKQEYLKVYLDLLSFAQRNGIELLLYYEIKTKLLEFGQSDFKHIETFNQTLKTYNNIDLLLSVGGDGTFLSAVSVGDNHNIPLAGVNCGRLGFLADITPENLNESLLQFISGDYTIEHRSMLEVTSPKGLFGNFNYGVNELTVHKLDNSSMIQIETKINGHFLANYWADGLIIATPTGSTAYSLSAGGPIVTPNLEGLLITPIASHHLTVRPVVVPDDVEIELKVEGRGSQFLLSVDHRSLPLDFETTIKISKAPVTIPLVIFSGHTFYSTLRNKMMWGADKRN